MSNKYEEARGVARLHWTAGDPKEQIYGTVLVEVWSSSLSFFGQHPEATVHAHIELRRFRGGAWYRLSFHGEWESVGTAKVRRHAYLPSRNWTANITLDGWGSV